MSAIMKTVPIRNRNPFAGFVSDDATLDALRTAVAAMEWPPEKCVKGGLRGAVQALSVASSPAILLVDLSECGDPVSEIDGLAEVCEPGTVVIAIGRVNDVGLYRELLAKGIHDYLPKPLSANPLREALERARAVFLIARDKAGEGEAGHVSAAVIGTRGGVGASMVATSLGWLLGTEHDRSTALLDLDVHFGTGALTLDLEPGRALTDAIENPGRIDGLFLERAMVRASDKLAIMSAEAPIDMPLLTDGAAFVRLEEEFRQSFDALVVDMPRSIMMNFPQLFEQVNVVTVVSEMTLASARDAIRVLSWLKANAPAARTIVVANKVQPGACEISNADFAAAIDRPVDFTIPYDHKGAINAARLGQTFAQANRSGKSVAPLLSLARAICDPTVARGEVGDEEAPISLLGRFDLKSMLSGKPKASAKNAPSPAA